MGRKRIYAAGAAFVAAAVLVPLSASGSPHRQAGAETEVEVYLGTEKRNDGAAEFRIYADKLRAAPLGQESVLDAGITTFSFENRGQVVHNFTIVARSAGGSRIQTPDIPPGVETVYFVSLKPGSYVAVSTASNGSDWAQGMVKIFTVGRFDPATGRWS